MINEFNVLIENLRTETETSNAFQHHLLFDDNTVILTLSVYPRHFVSKHIIHLCCGMNERHAFRVQECLRCLFTVKS